MGCRKSAYRGAPSGNIPIPNIYSKLAIATAAPTVSIKHTSSTEKPTNPPQITALANIQPSGTHASPLELFLLKNFVVFPLGLLKNLVSEDDKDDVKIYKQEVILLSKVNKSLPPPRSPTCAMARSKKKKAPPPHASPPADPPPELQAAGSDIEVNETERQSDIVMATPSISQATTGQPTKNEYDHPSKKREATSDLWDHFTFTVVVSLLSSSPDNSVYVVVADD
ncbi:hypothetical protein KEM48_008903 [Puccinia striiformis f. sp. tritici PST-130]|nr:hypothetical protein KEM48_008903 [Puccinia striiformis f. sp. tritici PST-130]